MSGLQVLCQLQIGTLGAVLFNYP